MPILPLNPALLVSAAITLLAVGLYLREYFLRKKDAQAAKKSFLETKQKSVQLLNAAEMAETQVISESNYASQKLLLESKAQLQNLIQEVEKRLTVSQDELIKFMDDLQKRSANFEEASRNTTEQRINQTFEGLENRLSDFLIQTEQKTTSSIELEIKSTRELIEGYKNSQLKLIDENILAMMEQTLNIVLGKKLSLKDQLDLVYEALEKAKVEKFVV